MFSSFKLNSLKCQSNSASEKKKDKNQFYENDDDDDDNDNVSDHMYEKLSNYDSKTCKCHSNYISRSPKLLKASFSKRINKWKMECPGITTLKISRPDGAKNNHGDWNNLYSQKTFSNIRTKVTTVSIEREDGNLGITLRGGFQQNVDLTKPVTITYIKPDGPAAREGTMKCGDRLLAVDGVPLQGRSLTEAQTLLRQPTPSTLLTIEYDVNVLDSVEYANGPLLVEMELNSFQELGIELGKNENGIIIESVKPGSLADRCGALHIGDEILAINSTRVDCAVLVIDVINYIESNCPALRLEILPSYATLNFSDIGTWASKEYLLTSGVSLSGVSTLNSHTVRRNDDCNATEISEELPKIVNVNTLGLCTSGFRGSNMVLTHSETIFTTLNRENGIFGLECIDSEDGAVVISGVIQGSPAERSQCLYPGDRILSINGRNLGMENIGAKELNELLEGKSADISYGKLSLHTEFDVLDSVIPTSGIFTVKLAKRGTSGLGITITASKTSGFTVCEMKKGSIAYRAGSLIPGDKILAINNIPLNQCSVEYAAHILHQSSNIVSLRVQRKDTSDTANTRKVTYTVELQRYGGPLGITIAGSEEPYHPITISGLTSGGLGEQTGVLQIGDEILAINNHNLYGEPLSKAHQLLQNSPDLVSLKISRSIVPCTRYSNNVSPILPPSIDSAVESWDSSRLDLSSSPDQNHKNLRNPRDCSKKNITVKQLCSSFSVHNTNEPNHDLVKTLSQDEIPDLSLLDEITSENLKIKKELDLLSLKLDAECKTHIKVDENEEKNGINDNGAFKAENREEGMNLNCENRKIDEKTEIRVDFSDLNVAFAPEEKDSSDKFKEREGEFSASNDFENLDISCLPESNNWLKSHYFGNESNPESIRNEFHSSQLYKVVLHKDPIYEDFGFSVSDGLYERGVFINRIRKGGPADLNNVLKPYDRILQVNETFTQDFDCCLTVPLIASAGDSIKLLVARPATNYLTDNIFENEKALEPEYSQNFILLEKDLERSQRILV